MRGVSRSAIVAITVLGMAVGAHAQTQSWNAIKATTTTNWNDTLSFPLFNPALGTLQSVEFTLNGNVVGNVRFESQDAAPATVTTQLKALLTLTRPDTSTLVTTLPTVNNSDNVSADDGVLDFGGTSGKTYLNITGNASNSFTTSAPVDLALFSGLGNIVLPISAAGQSNASGAGNLLTSFQTRAGADVTVTYHYQINNTNAPEPGSVALMGLGLAGFVAVRRRRRA